MVRKREALGSVKNKPLPMLAIELEAFYGAHGLIYIDIILTVDRKHLCAQLQVSKKVTPWYKGRAIPVTIAAKLFTSFVNIVF